MMSIIILKIIIALAILIFYGWQFTRRVLKQNELYLVVPLSLFLGTVSYVFFANLLGYIFGIQLSFYLAYLLLLFAGIAFRYFLPAAALEDGIARKHIYVLAALTISASSIFAYIFWHNHPYDSDWHWGLISTIANGVFPAKNIFAPFNFAQYHYAFDLLAASQMHILKLNVMRAIDVAYILYFIPLFWLAFLLIYKMLGKIETAYFGMILFFFGGGFRYFTILRDVDWSLVGGPITFVAELSRIFRETAPMSPGYFHEYSISAYSVMIYHSSSFFAFSLLLFVIFLMYLEDKEKSLRWQILLGLFLGFLALSSEVAFVFISLGWGIWKLFRIKEDAKRTLVSIFGVALICSFVAIFQGGVISDALLRAAPAAGQGADSAVSSFRIRSVPGLTSYGGFYPFDQLYSYAFLLVEWGFVLILFPLAIFLAHREKNRVMKLFFSTIAVSLVLAFFLEYPISPDNLSRFNVVAYIMMSVCAAYALGWIYSRAGLYRYLAIFILFGTIVSPLFFNIRLLGAAEKDFDEKLLKMSHGGDIVAERAFAQKASALLPADASVLTASPYMVNVLWPRLTYFGTPPAKANFYRDLENDLDDIFVNGTAESLKSLGIRYIYVNDAFIVHGGAPFIEKIKDDLSLVLGEGVEGERGLYFLE